MREGRGTKWQMSKWQIANEGEKADRIAAAEQAVDCCNEDAAADSEGDDVGWRGRVSSAGGAVGGEHGVVCCLPDSWIFVYFLVFPTIS